MGGTAARHANHRDRWIPWAIVAGFVGFLAASVVLSVIAARSDPGLVAGAPARLAGTNLTPSGNGPAILLRVVSREAGTLVIEAVLRDRAGRRATADELHGTLQRATTARDDRPVAFSALPDGAWRAVVPAPGAGAWDLAVEARGPDGAASATLRL